MSMNFLNSSYTKMDKVRVVSRSCTYSNLKSASFKFRKVFQNSLVFQRNLVPEVICNQDLSLVDWLLSLLKYLLQMFAKNPTCQLKITRSRPTGYCLGNIA